MSVCSWAIKGFGFDLDGVKFDFGKILEVLHSSWMHDALEDGEFSFEKYQDYLNDVPNEVQEYVDELGWDLMVEALENSKSELLFGNELILDYVSDGCDKKYLFYPSLMPWEIPEEIFKLSRNEMAEKLAKMLQPYTKQTFEELYLLVDDINTYGQG